MEVHKRASVFDFETSCSSVGRTERRLAFSSSEASERMRARGARHGLDMAGLVSARLVVATKCGHFPAHASSKYAGACAHAGRAPLASDHRPRCRLFRDDRRRSARAASTSSPDDRRAFGTLGAPGPGEGSAHQIAALVMWLKRHGVDFSDRARFVRVRGMGVGGVATRDLRQGDAVFSLPLFGVDLLGGDQARGGEIDAGEERTSTREETSAVPLVITTSVVMDQRGPLGRLARALAASGLVTRTDSEVGSRSEHAPTHRLGGVLESDHEFPLHVSATSLLALALLFQSAQATRAKKTSRASMRDRRKRRAASLAPSANGIAATEDEKKKRDACVHRAPHWSTYVDLLPRETDALLEWSDEDLYHLRGSRHVSRALQRRALVDEIHDEIFPALLAVDPGVLAVDDDEDDDFSDVSLASLETSAFASRRAFRWAFATVLARAFELPSEVREARRAGDADDLSARVKKKIRPASRVPEFGLCPGLDLFNHGDDAEPCVVEGLDQDSRDPQTDDLTTERDAFSGFFLSDDPEPVKDAAREEDAARDLDPDDARYDEDEARLCALGPRVTLRVGVGGVASGEQLFHKYADRADGGSVLEFGFARLDGSGARAADCDFSALLRKHAPGKRAARLAYLSALGLCRGGTYEVTDAPALATGAGSRAESETSAFFSDSKPRVGVACVPEDALRVARILTLTDSEFDAVRAWDDDDAGKYDGSCAFGAAHRRRFAKSMVSLFERERDALSVPAIRLHESSRGENETVVDDDDARARRARRRAMARCVHEGETSLLEEIARDFRRLAEEA